MRQHRTAGPPCRPWRRVTSIVAASVGILSGMGWGMGCSVIYGLDTQQCESTADCTALGGVFTGLECVNDLCQLPAVTGCQSNAECIDQEGDGFRPYACLDRECVALLTPECPTILPQEDELAVTNLRDDDDTLILAGTGTIDDTAVLDVRLMNYDLALTELETYVGGLGAGGRQVVMLGCKAVFDSNDELDRMMAHLVKVKVPGLVAAMVADDLQRAWTEHGDAADLFFMSPLESDPTLATLMDRGLMWHIGPGADVVARAYAPLLTRVIQHLAVAGTVKVATVLTADYRFLNNAMLTIESPPAQYGLFFNGKSVMQNRTEGNYRGVSISADVDESAAAQVQELVSFQPTVVVSAADSKFLQDVVPAIEAGWPTGVTRPFYLLSPFNYNDPALEDLIAGNASLATRMLGVNWAAAPDSTAYDAYVGRWQFAYPDPASRDQLGYENFYDAAYYLIYAAAAAGQNLQSGANLAQGMSRLLTGPAYSVGPDRMGQAMGILSVPSASIQLDGTLGPPDFNLDGTRDAPGSIWCIDSGGVYHPDWLRYVPGAGDDPTQATLTSGIAASCIDGF